eukprot:7275643-Ditylum_brightwellii.AAC.1
MSQQQTTLVEFLFQLYCQKKLSKQMQHQKNQRQQGKKLRDLPWRYMASVTPLYGTRCHLCKMRYPSS